MPTLNEMFPSQYLSGEDLGGKSYTLVMRNVYTETIFDVKKNKHVKKWVLYFDDAKKGCLIGKTQASQIFEATGTASTDEWTNKKVEVYPTTVKAFGEDHLVPRFRKPTKMHEEPAPAAMQQEVISDESEEHEIDQANPLGLK
jgi:hypothetical protein